MEQLQTGGENLKDGAEAYALACAQVVRKSASVMATLTTQEKNQALEAIAKGLAAGRGEILAANQKDMEAGEKAGLGSRLDRLLLTQTRLDGIISDIANVVSLPDPVGQEIDGTTRPNGIRIRRVRAPLGVIGIIYEARPNVTVDATVLCLKSGNGVLLKGGSDALHSNRAIVGIMQQALAGTQVPPEAIGLLDSADRAVTGAFLKLRGLIDVIIPRGSLDLIRFVRDNALVPVIETGASVVHAYVDEEVNATEAVPLIVNAKTRRVSICSALDTLLVHQNAAEKILLPLGEALAQCQPGVEVRADDRARAVLEKTPLAGSLEKVKPDEDYGKEFLDYVLAVRIVESMEEALSHIETYSLKHTEAIYTTNQEKADLFFRQVDAACVIHNASTQFVDGAEFGMGAEIGISTQKMHVRGPFALEGLTGMKWELKGSGQIRPL